MVASSKAPRNGRHLEQVIRVRARGAIHVLGVRFSGRGILGGTGAVGAYSEYVKVVKHVGGV